jgi:phage gpG-like protein
MLNLTLIGDQAVIARFNGMNDRIRQRLFAEVTVLAADLERHVKEDKLSGQVLQHRTGQLQQSIHNEVNSNGSSVIGRVFSAGPLPYAAIHEFGGQIPDRYPVNAKALHFFIGGKEIFAKFAKGFAMPERSYLRSSLADFRQQIIDGLSRAVGEAVKA